jgi:S-methylmethionine-dependent homocysteine/selenocysteine methylase
MTRSWEGEPGLLWYSKTTVIPQHFTCYKISTAGLHSSSVTISGLNERLQNGGNIVIAEGYMWEFERRGYLKSGGFVPEVVIEHPEMVRSMHYEYVHAGSDVVEAFTDSTVGTIEKHLDNVRTTVYCMNEQ